MQSKYILLICATKIVENLPKIAHFLIFCAVVGLTFLIPCSHIYIIRCVSIPLFAALLP